MTETNALGINDTFNSTRGFSVAAALTDYVDADNPQIDPRIGELVFTHYKWGEDSDGKKFSGRYLLPSHRCSEEELGREGPEKANIFPVAETFQRDFEQFSNNFICPDQQDIDIFGDYNTQRA